MDDALPKAEPTTEPIDEGSARLVTPPPSVQERLGATASAVELTEYQEEPHPVRFREVLAIAVTTALADLTIFRGGGFAGYGLFIALAPICLAMGSYRRWLLQPALLFTFVLWLISARLVWCGSQLAVASGCFCLIALAMALAARRPHVLPIFGFAGNVLPAAARRWVRYFEYAHQRLQPFKEVAGLPVAMPLAAAIVFGGIFLMSNPDLVAQFSKEWQHWIEQLSEWLVHSSWGEVLFVAAAAWITIGLLRPGKAPAGKLIEARQPAATAEASLYSSFRNTLIAVIAIYAFYLVFEFRNLWYRTYPPGFYYSGYAHEGAAWLTFALALATLMLSLIFRGQMLRDPRLGTLKQLGWVWSALNLLLAVAVYQRLWIYVGFNGMTWMRMVGFFGTSAAVLGFILAVYKIARNRSFLWLVRADLWALAATVILFAITPVDMLVMRYNAQRIMAGDSAPSVQIAYHDIDSEGVGELLPLANCPDGIVRAGVLALFAQRRAELKVTDPEPSDWSSLSHWQGSEELLKYKLDRIEDLWRPYKEDLASREAAWAEFRKYAYQWY